MSHQLTPCLWFDRDAEAAAKFYTSIFPNSKIGTVSHYGDHMPLPKGTVLTVSFTLDGKDFLALNGGPMFKFTEAVSFMVDCATQKEIDYFWDKLSEGGQKSQCGWLKDKYGLSWQIVPAVMPTLMQGKNSARVMQALMQMTKLDIQKLTDAASS